MKNWKFIEQQPSHVAALVILCQDYVLLDEEFMANPKIEKNMRNTAFLCKDSDIEAEYDECEVVEINDVDILNFIMDPTNRFELNDLICQTIENWLKHFGSNHF